MQDNDPKHKAKGITKIDQQSDVRASYEQPRLKCDGRGLVLCNECALEVQFQDFGGNSAATIEASKWRMKKEPQKVVTSKPTS